MMNLWSVTDLHKLSALKDAPYEQRVAAIKTARLEADKTLMRIMDLMMLMADLGAEVCMNYEETGDGKSGDISLGVKLPNKTAPRFEPEATQDNQPGSIH